MAKSNIAWTERTWNPVTGCSKASAGCAHCYAEVMAKRLQGMGQERYANGFNVTLHPEVLNEPKKIKKPSMFFVCSMGDLFHHKVPFEFVDKVMQVIRECPQHTFQVLTKRPSRMYEYFYFDNARYENMAENMWLGTTVECADTKERIQYLTAIDKASVRFLSCEPLLSDLGELDLSRINWVIVGGESGNKARPMKKEWVLNIQRQCKEQDVPFFFKQWGTYGEDGVKRDKKANGCVLDGVVYHEWPKIEKNA